MKIGLFMFSTDYAMRPDDLARATEQRGFESLFFPEHTHIPCSRRSPWPGGKELPQDYWHTHDLFIALAMASAVTRTIRLGTGICLVVERDPITTAKEVATLDFLSGGRVLFGVGGGWNAEEMENHGTDFQSRWKLMRERIAAMKAIWQNDEAEYHGERVRFDRIWSYPKPQQKPHPPVLVGGNGPHARRRAVAYGNGWMPLPARGEPIAEGIRDLHARAEHAGRDPRSIPVTIFGGRADAAVLDEYRAAGVERVLFAVPAKGADAVLPLLDGYAKFLGRE
ncbi:MAG: LLM class F420-dependent oxidoreductase [Deltaproteobacteria bacterium]|nr:LLM class F420-dependent oxidoreductase [Deltaproteobacteria bacterium]